MLPIRNISYLLPMCCSFWEKCKNSPKTGLGCSTPLSQVNRVLRHHQLTKYTWWWFNKWLRWSLIRFTLVLKIWRFCFLQIQTNVWMFSIILVVETWNLNIRERGRQTFGTFHIRDRMWNVTSRKNSKSSEKIIFHLYLNERQVLIYDLWIICFERKITFNVSLWHFTYFIVIQTC